MAENSGKAHRRAATTIPRMIAIALAVFVLAVLLLLLLRLFARGDEPPIRVRNGSMNIELVQGQWDDSGDGWSLSGGWNWGTFEVKVTSANGHACSDGRVSRLEDLNSRIWTVSTEPKTTVWQWGATPDPGSRVKLLGSAGGGATFTAQLIRPMR